MCNGKFDTFAMLSVGKGRTFAGGAAYYYRIGTVFYLKIYISFKRFVIYLSAFERRNDCNSRTGKNCFLLHYLFVTLSFKKYVE